MFIFYKQKGVGLEDASGLIALIRRGKRKKLGAVLGDRAERNLFIQLRRQTLYRGDSESGPVGSAAQKTAAARPLKKSA